MEMDSIKAGNSPAAGVLAGIVIRREWVGPDGEPVFVVEVATITVFVFWVRTVVVDLFTVCC